MSTEWFLRNGKPVQSEFSDIVYGPPAVVQDAKDRGHIVVKKKCSRCGGAGASDRWLHTGRTCYDCGGAGFLGMQTVKVYTAGKLVRLNRTLEKRRAHAERRAAEKAAAEEKARLAQRGEMQASIRARFGHLFPWLAEYEGENKFIREMRARYAAGHDITVNMADAIVKARDRDAARADWDSRIEALKADRVPVPAGRGDFEGYIVSAKWKHGPYGSTLKLLVVELRGFSLWLSAPRGLFEYGEPDDDGVLIPASIRKLRISFKATAEPSQDDRYFGFAKRPTLTGVVR